MQVTMYRPDLPDWVKSNIMLTCRYCGSLICDNSDTGVMTARWCANKKCPGHMMHKIKFLADFFGIKQIGPETALQRIRERGYHSHLDIMDDWFPDKKPVVALSDVAVLACLEGYGKTLAEQELNNYNSFEDYFKRTNVNPILLQHKEELLEAEKHFFIKPALSTKKMLVMGTGSFHGFDNREQFFNLINDAYGQYVQIIQTGKRKTGVSFLIKEKDAVDHSKSQIARECSIPIITPAEFLSYLHELFPYVGEEK